MNCTTSHRGINSIVPLELYHTTVLYTSYTDGGAFLSYIMSLRAPVGKKQDNEYPVETWVDFVDLHESV